MKNLHEENLIRRMEAIAPDVHNRLEHISEFSGDIATQVVATILQSCCCGQNDGSISAGRIAFKRLSETWLNHHLPTIVDLAINLADEWEYRRFLELLKGIRSPLLHRYIEIGLASENSEVREAACDVQS